MKKTTLYKLVKQALFESFKEERGGILKGTDKNLEKITLLERLQANDYLIREEEKKKRLLREQKERTNAKEIYNFLLKNSNDKVSLDKIADNPILTKINIDGLSAIYNKISTLSFEEFLELLPDFSSLLTNYCGCYDQATGVNSCPNYGTMQIYESGCQPQAIAIDDRFVCCSSNNVYSDDNQLPLQIQSTAMNVTQPNISSGQGYCFDPANLALGTTGGPSNVGQISYNDLNTAVTAMGSSLISPNIWNPSYYSGVSTGTNGGPDCLGCAHPLGTGYNATSLGCDDGGGIGNPANIDCCQFSGCGASQTTPPANNVTVIAASTNANGYAYSAFDGDEQEPWWTATTLCTWDNACTLGSVIINGTSYPTTTPNADDEVTSTYGSSYDGTIITDNGQCEVNLCTNSALDSYVDAAGQTLVSTFVTSTTGNNGTYTVVDDDFAQCAITACGIAGTPNGSATYINFIEPPSAQGAGDGTLAGDYSVTHDVSLCVATQAGCGSSDPNFPTYWNNYNNTVNVLDNTCAFTGCTDNTGLSGPQLNNYVCSIYPELCEDTVGNPGQVCQQACSDGTPDASLVPAMANATTPFTHNASDCNSNVVLGCTDPAACNQTQGANLDDGSCTYEDQCGDCYLPGDPNIDGCVGCTNLQSPNYNANGSFNNYTDASDLTDDGSCIFYECTTASGVQNYVCNNGTTTTVNDAWNVAQSYLPYQLCEDASGNQLGAASNTGIPADGTGQLDIGTFINNGCTPTLIGCQDDGNGVYGYTTGAINSPFFNTGQANNYDNSNPANVACTAQNSTCEPATPGGPIQQTTNSSGANYNPDGCCCTYTPGCTDSTASNYDPNANQDDGSCIAAVYGCKQPGMTNYDPLANVVYTFQNPNPCEYEGCVDDGSNYGTTGGISPSNWNNYVCLNQAQVTDNTVGSPTQGQTKGVGEWLCDCTGFGNGQFECNENSQFTTNLGRYQDTATGNVFLQEIGYTPTYDTYSLTAPGSCAVPISGVEGCTIDTYYQDDGTGPVAFTPSNYNTNFTTQIHANTQIASLPPADPDPPNAIPDVYTCDFVGCATEGSTNYFCDIPQNNQYCTTTSANFAPGCDPNATECLDQQYGELLQASYPCMGLATYNCGPNGVLNPTGGGSITPYIGCQDPGDGTGLYKGSTAFYDCMAECKECTEVTAKKCNGNTIRNYTCDGLGGSDGLEIDGFSGNFTGPGQIWMNTVTAPYSVGQFFRVKEKLPTLPAVLSTLEEQDNPSTDFMPSLTGPKKVPDNFWVTYEVTSMTQKFATKPAKQAEGTNCLPLTWDCRCLRNRPCQVGDANYNGTVSMTTGHSHYCTPNTKGTGQSATLEECREWCPCEARGPLKGVVGFGGEFLSPKKLDSCSGHGSNSEILPKSCDNPKYYYDEERPDIKEPDVKEPVEPTTDKPIDKIDIDTVEPVDIDRPTEPTGSVNIPDRPIITPDTPELKESRRLRKLIKKWKKNNL